MAWSTPPTFVASSVLTAAQLNVLSGDVASLGAASAGNYASSAVLWKGSVTDPVLGNGTYSAKYRQDNKWVDVFVQITMGSTTTYGSGTWQITLPVAAVDTMWGVNSGRAIDASASTTQGYKITADATSTTFLSLRCDATTAGNMDRIVTSAQPFTWATGDILTLNFRYEAA